MSIYENTALFEAEKLVAPAEIIGELKTPGGYTKTTPREWTEAEIKWLTDHKSEGYSVNELAEALGRTSVSVQIKLKRLTKTNDVYNQKNRDIKYSANKEFAELVNPASVLDVYSGNSWWLQNGYKTVTNDIDAKFKTDFSLDALDLLCTMKLQGKKFDLVDLDPYGSAYELFDLAVKLAKKGIVVSFGEWGHKRWKRFDFVKPRYGISDIAEFGNGEAFITEFQRIAACNKKHAEPIINLQYSNFVRVYFRLEDIKITEQWGSK
jgi:hypothetical protein